MRFLLDAHIPRRLCLLLRQYGHDALHTFDLPQGNRTPDADIVAIADREDRIVVSKDADFVQSFIFHREPRRLLLVATGNIGNRALEALLLANLVTIEEAFVTYSFLELTADTLIIHA